jgi:hypothetical protein
LAWAVSLARALSDLVAVGLADQGLVDGAHVFLPGLGIMVGHHAQQPLNRASKEQRAG